MTKPLLDVQNLNISFAGKTVVQSVNFSIAPGEKLALVGESGSGKTVTALSLLRLVQGAHIGGRAVLATSAAADTGKKNLTNRPLLESGSVDLLSLSERDMRSIRGRDIAMIFQEPMTALNPLYTVGHQIAEVVQLKQGLGQSESAKKAVKLLAETGIREPERRANSFPHQLSGGQRQRAMIAMALACQPKLLLADEPTTALDVTLRSQILDLLDDLQRRNGMAVLLITHDLNLVRRFADRVAVMENGFIVEQGIVGDVFSNPQHPYTRKLIDSKPTRNVVEIPLAPVNKEPVMQAGSLRVTYPIPISGIKGWFKSGEFVAVKDATFHIPFGRTLGVVGESGSGKSTLALASLGLLPYFGELRAVGRNWSKKTANNLAIRRHVQVVFQDPFSSLSPRMTVQAIVEEGLLVHEPALAVDQRRLRVLQSLTDVGMSEAQFPGLLERYPHEFSGGQRQRLVIARALIINPTLLILDEPTSALDVTIQKQVLTLLQRLQRDRQLSYLLITHDVDVIRAMAHDVLVMRDGEVLESGTVNQILDSPQHPYTRTLVTQAN